MLALLPGLIVIALAGAYLYPGYLLLQYATHIGAYVRSGDLVVLEKALAAQKSFWQVMGVLTIVAMVMLFVLPLLMSMAMAGLMPASR